MNLSGIIIITGSTGLLGQELIRQVSSAGGYVIVCGTTLKKANEAILKNNIDTTRACAVELDLTDEKSIDAAVNFFKKEDILPTAIICNASCRGFEQSKTDRLDYYTKFFQVDTIGHLILIEKLIELQAQLSAVVMVSSIYGMVGIDPHIYPDEMQSAPLEYAISKSAIKGMVRSLAAKYGEKGIRFNSIISGGIQNNQSGEFVENYCKKVPLGRMARVEEVGNAILFLISQSSAYITGSELVVDGGFTAI